MHTSSGDDEASKDPRIGDQDFSQQYTENDFEGKFAVTFSIEWAYPEKFIPSL